MKSVIFEFPTNLGLKKKEYEAQPGVRQLPTWLRNLGLYDRLDVEDVFTLEAPPYSMEIDPVTGVRNANQIIEYARKQSQLLNDSLPERSFFVALGGDCSILIGIGIALRQRGRHGLFFLDGHTDYVSPANSASKAVAGMDLAIATGYGHEKLTDILNLRPYFSQRHVWCVGNREFDPVVVDEIRKSDIHYVDLNTLRETGLKKCTSDFLDMVENEALDGFFLHLDVDVLNDDIMPAVDSRQEGGLSYPEMHQILVPLLSSPKALGIEITILDPTLDPEGKYTTEFVTNFTNIIRQVRSSGRDI
jgi:arginase